MNVLINTHDSDTPDRSRSLMNKISIENRKMAFNNHVGVKIAG